MPSLEMGEKVYKLTKEIIESLVGDSIIGNYALGRVSQSNVFFVQYVGRSCDLKKRLIEHLQDKENYQFFKFSTAIDEEKAYLKECKNYHDFGGSEYLNNNIHPAKPSGLNIKCPYCDK